MAYSNVTPPPLPEYDTEIYGFYILVFSYEIGAEDWYSVQLRYAPWRFSYDEALGITNGGNNFLQVYGDGTWGDWGQNQETLAIKPGQVGKTYQRIYTNHNIFDANDEIYMAADTILPPDENRFPIRDCINGLVMTLCCRPIQWPDGPQREPVAYLYNGVQLPALPKWDKEKYPYAHIWAPAYTSLSPYITMYKLTVTNSPIRYGTVDGALTMYNEMDTETAMFNCPKEDGEFKAWEYHSETVLTGTRAVYPFWTNHNVISDTDYTVYYAASEPIPVYE